ncbi:hypothetical protein, conserved [Leishmania tarentolae]|uniref:Regulator of microtubule dynamics protein 1 n=1 Tax=Leishmania tarentolae TaxID=5689 RepID=A0A640KG45_LEITA|nr:hypothetical protein, conserved [Leishmania tarentolae]
MMFQQQHTDAQVHAGKERGVHDSPSSLPLYVLFSAFLSLSLSPAQFIFGMATRAYACAYPCPDRPAHPPTLRNPFLPFLSSSYITMSDWETIAKKSEEVLATPDIKGCHAILMKAYEDGHHHPEILWRLGRSYYEMANESADPAVREPYMKEGMELCKKSVEADPNNFSSHKWLGILISEQKASNKEKIANAYVIRDHFLKAVELNPNDATSLHCMGNWCFKVLQIGWLERKAAALILGEPPTSTYEECLGYLLRSAEAGNTIHNSTMIGDVYVQQSMYDEARQWYQKAIDMPVYTELQKRNHDVAVANMKKL